jgi:DNA-binding MarR family transcriptional regulator
MPSSKRNAANTEFEQDALSLDFDSFIIGLLTRLSARVRHLSSKVYIDQCGVGISEARVLGVLRSKSDVQAARICEFAGMDKALVGRCLSNLVEKKLVAENCKIGKRPRYRLTAKGKKIGDKIILLAFDREKRLLNGLSKKDVHQMENYFQRMMTNVEDIRHSTLNTASAKKK